MKKAVILLLAVSLLCLALPIAAFAAIPDNSVIVGAKAYDLTLLDTDATAQMDVVVGIETAYVKIGGNILMATDGAPVNAALIQAIPVVTYKAVGVTKTFAAGDGAEQSSQTDEFCVVSIE